MSDILTRVFGPDPDSPGFPAFNEAKVIPSHTCEWVETRTWVRSGCRVRCASRNDLKR